MPHTRYHRRHHTWPHCGSELCMREPRGLELHVSKPDDGPAIYIPGSVQVPLPELLCDDMGMPELSRQPRRMGRLWFRAKERDERITLSGSRSYRSVLRRLTRRPPLNKSRSLVVSSNVGGDVSMRRWGDGALARGDGSGLEGLVGLGGATRVERRHRRCHSEQPRAWRKPSATLWTLQEHEE